MDKDDTAQTPHGISRDRQETAVMPAAAQTHPETCHMRSDTDKHDRHRAPVGSDCLYDANALVHNAEKTHRFQKQTDGHQRGTAVGRTQSGVYHIHTSEYKTSNRSPTGTYYIDRALNAL